MNKIDWKRKLTSRKFWISIVGLVTGLIVAFGGSEEATEKVGGCIMSAASVVAYIVGEGLSDAAGATAISTKDNNKED
ncbi:MAG: phage holin family protein [Ruminiclostridium sp.]|nr:phage holin family protein [Ruminiclostridium sp.]